MINKTIFSIDGGSIMKIVNDLIRSINKTRFVVTSTSGKEIVNMSLLWVIVLGIILPFLTITAVIVGLVLSYKVSLQKEVKSELPLLEK